MAHEIHRQIGEVHPAVGAAMTHVDTRGRAPAGAHPQRDAHGATAGGNPRRLTAGRRRRSGVRTRASSSARPAVPTMTLAGRAAGARDVSARGAPAGRRPGGPGERPAHATSPGPRASPRRSGDGRAPGRAEGRRGRVHVAAVELDHEARLGPGDVAPCWRAASSATAASGAGRARTSPWARLRGPRRRSADPGGSAGRSGVPAIASSSAPRRDGTPARTWRPRAGGRAPQAGRTGRLSVSGSGTPSPSSFWRSISALSSAPKSRATFVSHSQATRTMAPAKAP